MCTCIYIYIYTHMYICMCTLSNYSYNTYTHVCTYHMICPGVGQEARRDRVVRVELALRRDPNLRGVDWFVCMCCCTLCTYDICMNLMLLAYSVEPPGGRCPPSRRPCRPPSRPMRGGPRAGIARGAGTRSPRTWTPGDWYGISYVLQ